MRHLKFRGFNKKLGWVYGFPFYSYGTGEFKITCSNNWVPSYSNPDEGEHTEYIDIIHETLQQFTGLKDQKGNEIYEGDIVECKMSYNGGFLPHMGEIVYLENFGAFATKNLGGETLLHHHLGSSYKIVGNIHENPNMIVEK